MLKQLALALTAALCVSALASCDANAAVWQINKETLTSNVTVKSLALGDLTFEDTKAVGGTAAAVECEVADEGTVGTSGKDEVTSIVASECKTVKECETSGITAKAVHLPWHTQLEEVEGATRDKISSGGSGTPGWAIECLVFGLTVKDECTGETTTGTGNELEGVFIYFDSKSAHGNCTQGGTGAGVVSGVDFDQNPVTGRLGVSSDDPPCEGAPPTVTWNAVNENQTITILNCNAIARVDLNSVSDDKESEFKLAKTCPAGKSLEPLGNTNDHCSETITFTGKCETPHAKATFTVNASPGNRTFVSDLVGC